MTGWIPTTLRYYLMCLLILFNLGLIGSIAALTILSKKRSGILDVQDNSTASFISIQDFTDFKDWAKHLYWTTLPTFIVAIYATWLVSVIAAVCERQPYVELSKPSGARGNRSILLDYRSMSFPLIGAVKNQHWILSVFLIGSIIANLSLTSLTSSLFSVGTATRVSQSNMLVGSAFNDTGVGSKSNLKPSFDIVSAALIYNASFPPWMSADYGFPNFTLANPSANYTSATSIRTNLTAYSAEADCVLPEVQGGVSASGEFEYTTFDRGCNLTGSIPLSGEGASIFYQTFAVLDCSATAGWSRMVLFTAVIEGEDPSLIRDVNFISCIPSYHQTVGDLTYNIAPEASFWNGSFAPSSNTDTTFQPTAWQVFENGLHLSPYFDPTATVSATLFALLIVNYAQTLSGTAGLQSSVLRQASAQVFRSTFAATAHLFFIQPLQQAISSTGTVFTQSSRLFVVSIIAWVMIAVLAFLCLLEISMVIYTYANNSILTEEPYGIIGMASMIFGGACENYARDYWRNRDANNQSFKHFVHSQNIRGRRFGFRDNGRPVIEELPMNLSGIRPLKQRSSDLARGEAMTALSS